jgi:four helix bundle protein
MDYPMGNPGFTHLIVWQKAHAVRLAVFKATENFPAAQQYRLTGQMQTAAISVPGNIAEGYGRRHRKDKAHFYTIAKGSADELMDYLILSKDVGYWPGNEGVRKTLEEVCRMLSRLISTTLGGF